MLSGFFKGKSGQVEDLSPKERVRIADDFMASVMREGSQLDAIARKRTQEHADNIEALSFVLHTLNRQQGITASAGYVGYHEDRLFCQVTISAGRAKMKDHVLMVWAEDDKILINEDLLSKKGAFDFMDMAARRDFMQNIAQILAKKERDFKIEDRMKGAVYSSLARREGLDPATGNYGKHVRARRQTP